jgi:hypothetical protein
LDSEPATVRGQHYDIVLNGVELGGGSIRIHKPDVQKKVFEDVLKIPPDIAQSRFGYMLQAFRYGAPPHGGIALGFDRLCAILCGSSNIRDVIAFPKTAKAVDLDDEFAERSRSRSSCAICISSWILKTPVDPCGQNRTTTRLCLADSAFDESRHSTVFESLHRGAPSAPFCSGGLRPPVVVSSS